MHFCVPPASLCTCLAGVPYELAGSSWEAEEERYVQHLIGLLDHFAPGGAVRLSSGNLDQPSQLLASGRDLRPFCVCMPACKCPMPGGVRAAGHAPFHNRAGAQIASLLIIFPMCVAQAPPT